MPLHAAVHKAMTLGAFVCYKLFCLLQIVCRRSRRRRAGQMKQPAFFTHCALVHVERRAGCHVSATSSWGPHAVPYVFMRRWIFSSGKEMFDRGLNQHARAPGI